MFKKDRIMKYSIKKFTVGIASVAIGSILFLGSNAQASDKVEENKTEVATTVNNAQPATAEIPTNKVEANKQQNTNGNNLTTNSNNTVEKKVEAAQPASTNNKAEAIQNETSSNKEVESNKKESTTASGLNVLDKRTTDSSNIKDLLTNIIKKNEEENAKQATNKVEVEAENDDKDVSYIYARLGWCKRKLGMCDEAIEDFNKAKKWGRNDAVINAEIGHCYKAKDEYEEALKYSLMLENFEEFKNDIFVLSNIANLYEEKQDYKEQLKYLEKIEKIGKLLSAYPDYELLVSGHTALAGTAEARQVLSEQRAAAVANYLVELGVREHHHVFTRGFGAEKPIAPNTTEANKARNRRVEITVLEK